MEAEGGREVLEEKKGGRCSRVDRREGIFSRVPLLATDEVEVEITVAPTVTEQLDRRLEPNVGATGTDATASSAARVVLDELPLVPGPPTPSLAPLIPPPSSSPPLSPPLAPAAGFAVVAAVAAAVAASVLPDDLVEGWPGEKEEEGAEVLALNGCWADLWNSDRRDLRWVTF